MNVTQRTEPDWDELARDLSKRVAAFAPDWTEPTGADPGVTIVELFGFLAESILGRADGSARGRARLRKVFAQLERADAEGCSDGTLSRNRYSFGQLLTAADFEHEQDYQRTKHRRHNRLLHGVGIVRGLAVKVEGAEAGGDPVVVVSPGLAIAADGEELLVCEGVTRDVCPGPVVCYVTVGLAERPTNVVAPGEASRIEESADVAVVEEVPVGHLAIARLTRAGKSWRADPDFRPARVSG
jgi:hypothetical protein